MPTKEFYLRRARELFDLAVQMSRSEDRARLVTRANEYQMLADTMPADDTPVTPTAPPTTVTQPMQQQQQKKQEDE
jgi:hypothetical protein